MGTLEDTEALTVGIDAAVTANHHVVVRRPEPGGVGQIVDEFTVAPTLDGLARLAKRLASRDVRLAVAEPTSMTWLGLSLALAEAGVDLALVGSRHVARLRGAVSGKNKSDVIDAQLLSQAGELFALHPAVLPDATTLALQRACRRRHKLLIASKPLLAADHRAGPVGVPRHLERPARLPGGDPGGAPPLAPPGRAGPRPRGLDRR